MGFKKSRYRGKRLASPDKRQEEQSIPRQEEQEMTAAETAEAVDAGENGAIPPPAEAKRSDKKEKKEKPGFWANYGYLLVTAAAVILIFRVLLQMAFVPSGSMEKTIPTDSLLLSWQLPYLVSDPQPRRGDVITFWSDELDKLLVKRVIGLPGEKITFSDGYVCVNGERLEEDYLPGQGITEPERQESYEVPEGCLFVLGDNRGHSTDSRFWRDPYVRLSSVRAKVLVCIPISYHPVGVLPNWRGFPLPILGDIRLMG